MRSTSKANIKKAFIIGFIICVLLYVYAVLQFRYGVPDFITLITLGKALLISYFTYYGQYEKDLIFGENTFLVICGLVFIFDYAFITAVLSLGFFIWEKIKAK